MKRENPRLMQVSGGALGRAAQMHQEAQSGQNCKRVPSGLCKELLDFSSPGSLEGLEVEEIVLLAWVIVFL